jgi:hypothetical protein
MGVLTIAKHLEWLHPTFVAPETCEFVTGATITTIVKISYTARQGRQEFLSK